MNTLHNGDPTTNLSLLDRTQQNAGMKTFQISQTDYEDAAGGSQSDAITFITNHLGLAAKEGSAAATDAQSASSEAQGQEEQETIAAEDEQQKNTNEWERALEAPTNWRVALSCSTHIYLSFL